jgi:hypothetical protein
MNSKIQARKIKRFNERKETVKTAMNNIVDIEILMAMTPDELKALKKTITKVNGLKKTYNAIYNPVIISTEYVSDSSDVEPETSEPETSEPETSEPETSEPETSEPETSELVFVAEISAPNIQQQEQEEIKYFVSDNDYEANPAETDEPFLVQYYEQEIIKEEPVESKLSDYFIDNKYSLDIQNIYFDIKYDMNKILFILQEGIKKMIYKNVDINKISISDKQNVSKNILTYSLVIEKLYNTSDKSLYEFINLYDFTGIITDISPVNIIKEEPINIIKEEPINIIKEEPINIIKEEPINIIKEEPINTIEVEIIKEEPIEPVEAESVIVENMTPAIEEYDADILAKIIKKYNPNSLKVKEFFFKDERKFIDKLTEEFTDVKTIRYYKKQIDMSIFDIYELDQKPAPEIQLKIFKTERPEYTINTDNVDEFITKNNIYINRKQTKKKDKVELILLNDILLKIKSNGDITEKEQILIEKKYCKDSFKQSQFSYYYNENFVKDPYKMVF